MHLFVSTHVQRRSILKDVLIQSHSKINHHRRQQTPTAERKDKMGRRVGHWQGHLSHKRIQRLSTPFCTVSRSSLGHPPLADSFGTGIVESDASPVIESTEMMTGRGLAWAKRVFQAVIVDRGNYEGTRVPSQGFGSTVSHRCSALGGPPGPLIPLSPSFQS